jgi:hypothetical protein
MKPSDYPTQRSYEWYKKVEIEHYRNQNRKKRELLERDKRRRGIYDDEETVYITIDGETKKATIKRR